MKARDSSFHLIYRLLMVNEIFGISSSIKGNNIMATYKSLENIPIKDIESPERGNLVTGLS